MKRFDGFSQIFQNVFTRPYQSPHTHQITNPLRMSFSQYHAPDAGGNFHHIWIGSGWVISKGFPFFNPGFAAVPSSYTDRRVPPGCESITLLPAAAPIRPSGRKAGCEAPGASSSSAAAVHSPPRLPGRRCSARVPGSVPRPRRSASPAF